MLWRRVTRCVYGLAVRRRSGNVVRELPGGRGFDFAAEHAVFVSVLRRLFVSGLKRSREDLIAVHGIKEANSLWLRHLYRATA